MKLDPYPVLAAGKSKALQETASACRRPPHHAANFDLRELRPGRPASPTNTSPQERSAELW